MLNPSQQQQLHQIWDDYQLSGKRIFSTRGKVLDNLDKSRLAAISDVKEIINSFMQNKLSLPEFKTNLDSYNKQHNFWGFTAAKGQMFFNLLTKSSDGDIDRFINLLKDVIQKPSSLDEAYEKLKSLSDYALIFKEKATDKRHVANPQSSAYFLSYFWQIHDHQNWPIMYSSMITSLEKMGLWEHQQTAYENYGQFFALNEEIKKVLSNYAGTGLSNWDVEHALWNFAGTQSVNSKRPLPKKLSTLEPQKTVEETTPKLAAGFELSDYLIPKVAGLMELGYSTERSSGEKGREFERMVAETFRLLDFEIELLGQGTGREPDAIIKYPGEHIAFLVDAKAYSNGYTLGTDDRAIREYISYYCPRLKSAGFNKIGFIIVSNAFKSDFNELINDITWTTDIKRFLLLTTEALLYLVAYKTKDKIPLIQIVETLIAFNKIITKEMIIEEFEDY